MSPNRRPFLPTVNASVRRAFIWRWLGVAGYCLSLFGAMNVRAAELGAEVGATLMLKVLSYDRKLANRGQRGHIAIAVIYKKGDPESEQEYSEVRAALEAGAKRFNVDGLLVHVLGLPIEGASKIAEDLDREKPAAVYVCASLQDSIPTISEAAQRSGILTFAGTEPYIKAGLGVGLVRRGTRPSIVVNLPETRAEAADLDSAFLRVAEVLQ